MTSDNTVTQLLGQWRRGDVAALDLLMPLVYGELRKLAAAYMRSERDEHTLQHTALVHEAYLRLVQMEVDWNDRAHFFAVAARAMRRILVDHARSKKRTKRDGEVVTADVEVMAQAPARTLDILVLDDALQRLEADNPRQSEILQLRYFGGMTSEEIAGVLKISVNTVDRDLKVARAWLMETLRPNGQ